MWHKPHLSLFSHQRRTGSPQDVRTSARTGQFFQGEALTGQSVHTSVCLSQMNVFHQKGRSCWTPVPAAALLLQDSPTELWRRGVRFQSVPSQGIGAPNFSMVSTTSCRWSRKEQTDTRRIRASSALHLLKQKHVRTCRGGRKREAGGRSLTRTRCCRSHSGVCWSRLSSALCLETGSSGRWWPREATGTGRPGSCREVKEKRSRNPTLQKCIYPQQSSRAPWCHRTSSQWNNLDSIRSSNLEAQTPSNQ